ncbi:MAG: hypothetical protein L6V95_04020 [Candidatus Melainabacteria bacterium]|nr:MAG: hypothetical protein L6V95_04020 [Candidatus Melainabacteria bacterium]
MTQVPRTVFSIDKLDTTNFNGVVNKTSKIDSLTQNRIKLFYTKILDAMKKMNTQTLLQCTMKYGIKLSMT